VKEQIKKRWWWVQSDEKNKKMSNFNWTQLKDKTYFHSLELFKNSLSTRRSHSHGKTESTKIEGETNYQ
jgi:hypothetical protein